MWGNAEYQGTGAILIPPFALRQRSTFQMVIIRTLAHEAYN